MNKPLWLSRSLMRKMAVERNKKRNITEIQLPDWLSDEDSIEPEKTKIVLFLKKGETIASWLRLLGNSLGRMPTDQEIINYFW